MQNNPGIFCSSCGNKFFPIDISVKGSDAHCPNCDNKLAARRECPLCREEHCLAEMKLCDNCGLLLCRECAGQNIKQATLHRICSACEELYEREFNMNICDIMYDGRKTEFQLTFDELYWLWLASPESVNLNASPINIDLKGKLISILDRMQSESQSDLKMRLMTVLD